MSTGFGGRMRSPSSCTTATSPMSAALDGSPAAAPRRGARSPLARRASSARCVHRSSSTRHRGLPSWSVSGSRDLRVRPAAEGCSRVTSPVASASSGATELVAQGLCVVGVGFGVEGVGLEEPPQANSPAARNDAARAARQRSRSMCPDCERGPGACYFLLICSRIFFASATSFESGLPIVTNFSRSALASSSLVAAR